MYSFPVDVSPEFARSLHQRGQVYLEMEDGRMIPVTAVPSGATQKEHPDVFTVPVLFTPNDTV